MNNHNKQNIPSVTAKFKGLFRKGLQMICAILSIAGCLRWMLRWHLGYTERA